MTVSCAWNRGLLLATRDGSRWLQLTIGKGGHHRRLLWYPRLTRCVSLRVWGYWWISLGWRIA